MSILSAAESNLNALRSNPYPGRGIVIGQTPDARHLVQVYWIMGRSENSRNRVFVREGDVVRTAPYDASKVKDPSLIIYNCARVQDSAHIVSNGDQTDTICDALAVGESFENALDTREFEPDAPNYTARIAGLVDLDDGQNAYKLAILKTLDNNPERPVRYYFNYERAVPGIGHFIATYKGDGSPLPAFEGEPQPVVIPDGIEAVLDRYWSALDNGNKVSLMAKFIDVETGASDIRIVNKHGSM